MMSGTGPRRSPSRAGSGAVRAYTLMSRLRSRLFSAAVRGGFAHFGEGSSITPPTAIGCAAYVRIGERVVLGPYCRLLAPGPTPRGGTLIEFEDDVSIAGFCTISAVRSIVIGAGALFARNVYIADHSHAFEESSRWVKDQGIDAIAPVRIGRGAWLGEGVVVMPGVTVGDGAVVGANSTVRDDVPPYSLAVGSPARVVRSWS